MNADATHGVGCDSKNNANNGIMQVPVNNVNNSLNCEVQDTATPMESKFTDGSNFNAVFVGLHMFWCLCQKVFLNFAHYWYQISLFDFQKMLSLKLPSTSLKKISAKLIIQCCLLHVWFVIYLGRYWLSRFQTTM